MAGKAINIGIIASVRAEAEIIICRLKGKRSLTAPFFAGRLSGRHVSLVISGIGKTNAAHAAAFLALKYRPSLIINLGIGGAYPSSGLKIGDLAIAEKEIYGDEGVALDDGFHGTELIGIPLLTNGRKRFFNEFPLDRWFVNMAFKVVGQVKSKPDTDISSMKSSSSITVKKGAFLTISTCTGTSRRANELEKRFNAICENMEGAAIAHVCRMHDIPFIEIRGISNMAGKRDLKKWNMELAAENCQKAVLRLFE